MVDFESSWNNINGQRILYVHPKSEVFDEDWVKFFKSELKDYRHEKLLLLINVIEFHDNIGFDGFSRITELLKNLEVKSVRIAVLPSNKYFSDLAKLFDGIAIIKGLDLKIELHHKREKAETWLGSQ